MPAHKWNDLKRSTSPRARARVARQTALETKGGYTLRHLRRLVGVTQAQVAKAMGLEQNAVSQLESRTDHRVSTLRALVEALGGRIVIVAEFPEDLRHGENVVTLRQV